MRVGESESPEELSLCYTIQGKAAQTFHRYMNKTQPPGKLRAFTENAGYEGRKSDGQINGGGIKRDGCEDRCGKVVRGRGPHVVVIR